MRSSKNNILTTHTGRLDPPKDLGEMTRAVARGESADSPARKARLRSAIQDIVLQQVRTGLDVVSDGELGKFNSFTYYSKRLSGLSVRPVRPDEPPGMWERTGERMEFAEFYEYLGFRTARERMSFTGPISYIGEAEVQADIDMLKAAMAGVDGASEAFMCVLAPGWLEHWMYNEYYRTDEEYLFAIADAMKHEYKAIVDAGFILQLDDPGLPDTYDMIVPTPSIEDYRKFAEVRVEALNHALK